MYFNKIPAKTGMGKKGGLRHILAFEFLIFFSRIFQRIFMTFQLFTLFDTTKKFGTIFTWLSNLKVCPNFMFFAVFLKLTKMELDTFLH